MKILAHTSFIGTTGYANHARSFFCALNKYHTVKVRNLTIGKGWKGMSNTPHNDEPYITKEMKDMLILQTLYESDGKRKDHPMYNYKGGFVPDVHIVLNDVNNPYFYEEYEGYKIAFNVYESTRYPDDFFKRLFYFDEVWVPTQWQFDSLVEQGYPIEKIRVVSEGVDAGVFKPVEFSIKNDKFRFLLFGRWDYRKSITEIIKTFGETFKGNDKVELVCSVENPYPTDETRSTKDRIFKYGINYPNVKFIDFVSRKDYVNYLQQGDVFVSCSRSEGWNLPLIEAMSCGTPAIYSNWGGQLQFARNKGIPVKISHMRKANIGDREVEGEYCEPDFQDLGEQMKKVFENYDRYKKQAIYESKLIHEDFNWDIIAQKATNVLEKKVEDLVFVTTGNLSYMPVIEKLVKSLNEFSKSKILVYGVDCDVPFESPNMIKRRIDPTPYSKYDKWYWKQHACIESLKEDYNQFVWIDGDVVVNYNIDSISQYFQDLENYPLSDIHIQEEFLGYYTDENGIKTTQLFNDRLCNHWDVKFSHPMMHICMYIYNKECGWWFEEILKKYKAVSIEHYPIFYLWNDEGIDNALRWRYGFKKHLPLSNFDTSSYDGDFGNTNQTMNHFYRFWNERGPQNFNRIYGYQFIPEDKSKILYFHGNKNGEISDQMIEFIKLKKEDSFHQSDYFYTDVYKLENLGKVKGIEGSTMDIAGKYGWQCAIYHEIYNLTDYYKDREKKIHEGDVVVDVGANMGIFTRWAFQEGASKVISFEPDHRYFKLLKLNSDPRAILFNAAVSDTIGTVTLHEAEHFGGSNIFNVPGSKSGYSVRTYTLNHLFESGIVDKIDFLKVDIEGAEINAFKGISDQNLLKVKTIAMEYHHSHLNYDEPLRDSFITRLNLLGFNSYVLFMGTNNALQMIYFSR